MFLWDLIFALAVGLVFAAIFSLIFRRTGPWASFFVFFIIIALASWAGGVWLLPVGPPLFGVFWIPFLIFGFTFAILLAASAPSRTYRSRRRATEDQSVVAAFDVFFIVLIGVLIAAIVVGYLFR
jgi:uncharacterized membrane protein YraQ (UPF0718 family)